MLNPVASGETDDGPLGVRPLAPAEPGPAALALPVDRVHSGHPDVERGFDRLPDLGLMRAGRDDEGVLAAIGQPQALLRDDRAQQYVPRVYGLVHCCPSSCLAAARATKLSRASLVKTTWSLTRTSLVFSWSSASTCTPGALRRLSLETW